MKKGTQLLEVYALEIQMYTEQKNNQKLKALYEQSLHIKSAIPHPLIMGVIRGKLIILSPHPLIVGGGGGGLTCHALIKPLWGALEVWPYFLATLPEVGNTS